jgi:PAS domain S-box-containing protein
MRLVVMYVSSDGKAPMDHSGEPQSLVDREKLEERVRLLTAHLAETQSQLQAIFNNSRDGIIILDKERNIIRINQAGTHLLGLVGIKIWDERVKDFYEICTPNGIPLPFEDWPTALAFDGHFVQNHEVLIRRNDTGQTVLSEISSAPVVNQAGDAVQFIIRHHDITEREQFDHGRSRLAAIVESSEDAIIGKDDRGYITSWNAGAEKIFGYEPSEMIGQSIKRLLPPELEREEDEILCRIKKGETVEHIETKRKRKDGKIIDVSLTISPIKTAAGKIIGASKIARDITEQRRIENQLQQSQKLEAIGQLTGGIAHDFNNLLGVIVGNLDLLERQIPNDETALKRVHTAQKAATRGAGLTQRLLAFSREDELRPTSTLLNDAIHNVIELATRRLGPEIKIATNLDKSMQPVFVDVAGLESALLNLVINAQDAMPNGGSLNITTESRNLLENYAAVQAGEIKAGRYASVSVSDSGHGMSREVLTRALEPFFTTKERNKGSGLGLAMVYGFVKQSGGTIRIYSETGLGTTVTFDLPFAERRAQPVSLYVEKMQSRASAVSVLVVDDETDLLEIAVAYLQDMGCLTFEAKDGATAFEIMMSHHEIELLVTDIVMPGGMNGVELVRKIRQFRPEIKIIYCSGFSAGALAERTAPLIDGPLLHKPYQRTEFDTIVRQALGKAMARPTQ